MSARKGKADSTTRTSPLNPAGRKHRFGKAWMHEHVNDPYVREAARRGYRSRAAFKLEELDARDRFLRPGLTVVDLGAAPGSWSQVLRERIGQKGTIVAIDLLQMPALAGVVTIEGDFEDAAGLAAVEEALRGRPVDLVVSDMSPNRRRRPGAQRRPRGACAGVRADASAARRRSRGQGVPGRGPRGVRARSAPALREDVPAQAEGVARSQPRALRRRAVVAGARGRGPVAGGRQIRIRLPGERRGPVPVQR